MIRLRRISGDSMAPALRDGAIVVFFSRPPRAGSIVLAEYGGREIVKRVERISGDMFYLVGDNRQESTDSRHYGTLSKSAILGVSMITLPSAVKPPKTVKPYGILLGRIAAAILIIMALIHLFRIDTFIPTLDNLMPGGQLIACVTAMVIILSEVFAVPFALRMKLSPLAHVVSGLLLAFAPLWWLLVGIWSFGFPGSIGIFGSFLDVPSAALVLVVCFLWVAFNYYTLYTLGYNRLKLRPLLKK